MAFSHLPLLPGFNRNVGTRPKTAQIPFCWPLTGKRTGVILSYPQQ